jgi:hypothetical protein
MQQNLIFLSGDATEIPPEAHVNSLVRAASDVLLDLREDRWALAEVFLGIVRENTESLRGSAYYDRAQALYAALCIAAIEHDLRSM